MDFRRAVEPGGGLAVTTPNRLAPLRLKRPVVHAGRVPEPLQGLVLICTPQRTGTSDELT